MDETLRLSYQTRIAKIVEDMRARANFNVCALDELVRMAHVIPDREAYQILQNIHCVDYNLVSREIVDRLPELVRKCVGDIPGLDWEDVFPQYPSFHVKKSDAPLLLPEAGRSVVIKRSWLERVFSQ